LPVFKTGAFNRSATPPKLKFTRYGRPIPPKQFVGLFLPRLAEARKNTAKSFGAPPLTKGICVLFAQEVAYRLLKLEKPPISLMQW